MKIPLPKFLMKLIINYAKRTPFEHLGDYMERYWFFSPKGLLSRWMAARVHVIKRGDADRHLHDHPWSYVTLILDGSYTEVTHHDYHIRASNWRRNEGNGGRRESSMTLNKEMKRWEVRIKYSAGDVIRRKAGFAHRLEVEEGKSATTLFMMGNYQNKWGFFTPEGKVYWRDYLSAEDVTKRAAVIQEHYNTHEGEKVRT